MVNFCERTGMICFGDIDLPLLFDISQMINNNKNIREVLKPAMEALTNYINAERSLLTILNKEKSEIFIETGAGVSEETKAKVRYKLGEGIIGEVIKTGEPVFIEKIMEDKRFLNKTKTRLLTPDHKDISFLCVPVKVTEETVGAISIYRLFSKQDEVQRDIRVLSIVGSMIARAVLVRQEKMEEIERLREENQKLQGELQLSRKHDNIIGNSGRMQDLFKMISRVSKTNATVLIRGESGVGKELVADAIHQASVRGEGAFVKVNCSALPETLIESELFGHEKGAFTGADQAREGRFEQAHGGTLFLDEIGDLPLLTQTKLLRTLQEKEIQRVGGNKTMIVDVRIIAATNKDLEKAIREGKFRSDLYYRINVFPVYIPPLRERINDIPALVDFFIEKCNRNNQTNVKRITSGAIDLLMVYHWPGNVRELENCIERAAILSLDGVIHSYNLPPTLQTAESTDSAKKGTLKSIVEKMEKQIIIDTLVSTKGNMLAAARQLDITERMMGTRIKKYNIDVKRFKHPGSAKN